MQVHRVCLSVLFALSTPSLASAEPFPYTASVRVPQAEVHSGPGQNHYATDRLKLGQTVEVHRHSDDGWAGIRPPAGSFSWVPARDLKPVGNGLAQVVRAQAPAYVGSRISPSRDAVQIRLDEGESVEILAEQSLDGENWYKIAPPAGEFRWIAQSDLAGGPEPDRFEGPASTALAASPVGTPVATIPRAEDTEPALDAEPTADKQRESHTLNHDNQIRPATRQTPTDDSPGGVWRPEQSKVNRRRGSNRPFGPSGSTTEAQMASTGTTGSGPERRPTFSAETQFDRDLARVEQALSAMMELEPGQWNLTQVKQEAQRIHDSARSAAERGPARRLLEKIARLEKFQYRHALAGSPAAGAFQPPPYPTTGFNPVPATSPHISPGGPTANPHATPAYPTGPVTVVETLLNGPAPAAARGSNPSSQSAYDGVGTLRPVVSRRGNTAPRFALVDSRGRVVTFLSAAPGVDLSAFVGQTIGVTGSRAFVPQLRRDHLMAERVTSLDGPQRR